MTTLLFRKGDINSLAGNNAESSKFELVNLIMFIGLYTLNSFNCHVKLI